jgi:hypothetical protein
MIDVSSHKGSFLFFVFLGRLAEWSNALDLKSSVPQGTVGSNPTSSATRSLRLSVRTSGFHPEKRSSILLGSTKVLRD